MKNKLIGLTFFIFVFVLMCVLKWWFTIYVIFTFALLMTVLMKKRNYCHNVCPVALMQSITYSAKSKTYNMKAKTITTLKWVIMSTFWVLLIGISIYYSYTGNDFLRWQRLLILMWTSIITAVILQEIYGKRIWCKYFCPMGKILDTVIKKIR